jgi:hypothetical protein
LQATSRGIRRPRWRFYDYDLGTPESLDDTGLWRFTSDGKAPAKLWELGPHNIAWNDLPDPAVCPSALEDSCKDKIVRNVTGSVDGWVDVSAGAHFPPGSVVSLATSGGHSRPDHLCLDFT